VKSSISDIEKRKRGRPATDATPVLVRLKADALSTLDAWIAEQPDPKPSRPEAIRRLLEKALAT
jgi:cytochrome c553